MRNLTWSLRSGWPNWPRKNQWVIFVSFYLHKFLKLYISQTKNCLHAYFLLLIFLLRGFFLLLIQWSSSRINEVSLEYLVVGSCFIRKKGILAEMTTRCHLLSLVVSLVVTHCYSLPFVAAIVVIRCHSLSSVVTRCITVCLFINDHFKTNWSMTITITFAFYSINYVSPNRIGD